MYYYHEGGDINDRKYNKDLVKKTIPKQNDVVSALPHSHIDEKLNIPKDPLELEKQLDSPAEDKPATEGNENGETAIDGKKNDVEVKEDTGASNSVGSDTSNTKIESESKYGDWRTKIQSIKEEFYDRYGGKKEAVQMLDRGVQTAADTEEHAVKHTAERIVRAVMKETKDDKKNAFVMSFGGYSVTVGRGNYFHQSYPFIMEKVLKPLFEDYLNLDLIVRNSAIGGIPSFPYGWCLHNFLGDDSDVISWDYGMNEGNGAEAFEAYLRQGISNLPKRPMMIMLDLKKKRVDLLKAYYKNGVLPDSIAVGRGDVVNKELLDLVEEERPTGLQNWMTWGAPRGSPGQSKWHPKYMEHELIGWMIAMHFVDTIEQALVMLESVEKDSTVDLGIKDEDHERLILLPEPVTGIPKGHPDAAATDILYGTPIGDNDQWHMDHVSCRSNFLPNINGHFSEIVVSGTAQDIGDDLMDKTDEAYSSGWVEDVGKVERDTKRKVAKVGEGGLGYIDMKLALYAIPESGTLKLEIPHEGPSHDFKDQIESDKKAPRWFDSLVFCEVNEKRGPRECKTEEDLTFIVGGVKSPSVTKITSAASYLKKEICVNVKIPEDAIVTEVGENDKTKGKVKLSVDVTVTGKHVNRKDGACSISHVVWQSH